MNRPAPHRRHCASSFSSRQPQTTSRCRHLPTQHRTARSRRQPLPLNFQLSTLWSIRPSIDTPRTSQLI